MSRKKKPQKQTVYELSARYASDHLVLLFVGVVVLLLLNVGIVAYKNSSKFTGTEITPEAASVQIEEVLPAMLVVEAGEEGAEEPTVETTNADYVEVTDSCNAYYEGECVRVRSGPGLEYGVVASLRNGMVLKVGEEQIEADEHTWYEIVFDEWLRYPERLMSKWYVSSDFLIPHTIPGEQLLLSGLVPTSTKYILVERSNQKLYAYEGEELFMETSVSTGIELSPTPRGEFTVFKKTPSRYMQGPLPYITAQDYYDLPGVPWNLYFTEQGAVIHGAYWHDNFGDQHSHGCVNVPLDIAKDLYEWADVGMKVVVRD